MPQNQVNFKNLSQRNNYLGAAMPDRMLREVMGTQFVETARVYWHDGRWRARYWSEGGMVIEVLENSTTRYGMYWEPDFVVRGVGTTGTTTTGVDVYLDLPRSIHELHRLVFGMQMPLRVTRVYISSLATDEDVILYG